MRALYGNVSWRADSGDSQPSSGWSSTMVSSAAELAQPLGAVADAQAAAP